MNIKNVQVVHRLITCVCLHHLLMVDMVCMIEACVLCGVLQVFLQCTEEYVFILMQLR